MHNPESIFENETHKILLDFDIQTEIVISARRPDIVTADHKVKLKEGQKRDKYLAREKRDKLPC